jgi:LPXTG-site transpeptidase (sortase) family protein
MQYVGITKSGKMATPNNFSDVGWFQYGTLPGDKGSAIIAGHVDNGLAFPAVFADLGNASVGDDVYVDTVGGSTLHFKVVNIKNYDAEAKTEDIFNQNDGKYIKLITCAGTWSIVHRTHDQRVVVTAEQVI